jgi:hypothetical protein
MKTTKQTDFSKKPMGRPPYAVSEEDKKQVYTMSMLGIPDYDIAKVMQISEPTLRKYFFHELEIGHIRANARVGQTLYAVATDPANPKCVTAAIFWLKARAGWKEDSGMAAMGKKEIQHEEAKTNHKGTEWGDLLPNVPLQ